MQREQIKALALANGFKLKTQPDGTEDLNPYVYEFAAALMAPLQAELKRQQDENSRLLFANRYNADMYRQIDDARKQLQAEVERLQADNDHQRERRNAARDAIEKGKAERRAIEQERDQLKDQLYKYGCEDIDVIRCLKTLAYEHNHSDVPRYKDLAKRTMDKYVDRCTSAGSALADHDAEVIERIASEVDRLGEGVQVVSVNSRWLRDYANQLRQQAKEMQS